MSDAYPGRSVPTENECGDRDATGSGGRKTCSNDTRRLRQTGMAVNAFTGKFEGLGLDSALENRLPSATDYQEAH